MSEYIDNKNFYMLIREYKISKSKKIYEEIGKRFLLIAQRLLNKSNFINYTPDRKDDMISDAVFYMCRYIDKFDLDKKNPFAYFTMIAKNAFLQSIKDYTKKDDLFTQIEYIDNCEVYTDNTIYEN